MNTDTIVKEKSKKDIQEGLGKGEGFPSLALRIDSRYYHEDYQKKLFEKGFSWDGVQEVRTIAKNGNFLTEILVDATTRNISEYDNTNENHPTVLTLSFHLYSEQGFFDKALKNLGDGNEFIPQGTDIERIFFAPEVTEETEEIDSSDQDDESTKESKEMLSLMRRLRRSTTREGCIGMWNEKSILCPFSHELVGYFVPEGQDEDDESIYNEAIFDGLYKKLLNLVENNIKYFVANPKEMAYVFWRYDRALTAARYLDQGSDNPKYPIIDIEENAVSDGICEDGLIYDAWGYSVSNESYPWDDKDIIPIDYNDPFVLLQQKPQKTIEEWVELLTDKRFKYSSIYPDRRRVLDHLICCIGNGYGWDKEGYICESGASDGDNSVYFDCFNHKPQGEVGKQLDEILNDPNWVKMMDFVGASRDSFKARKDVYKAETAVQDAIDLKEAQDAGFDSAEEHADHRFDLLMNKREGKTEGEEKKQFFYGFLKETPEEKLHASVRYERAWYPICNYSAMCCYPENTHQSYLDVIEEIALEIIQNPRERDSSIKEAKKVLKKMNVKHVMPIFTKTFKQLHNKDTGERVADEKEMLEAVIDILATFGFNTVKYFNDYTAYMDDHQYCIHFGFDERINHQGFDYNCTQNGFWMTIDECQENPKHPNFGKPESEHKTAMDFLTEGNDFTKYNHDFKGEWSEFTHGRGVNSIGISGETRNWGEYTTWNDSTLMDECKELGTVNFLGKYHSQSMLEFICRFLYDAEKKEYFNGLTHMR